MTDLVRNAIRATAARYHLPPLRLEAQVLVESAGLPDAFRYEYDFYRRYIRWNPSALAYKYGPLAACSYGLMQLMLEVAYENEFVGEPHQLFDPITNLNLGAKLMVKLLDWADGDYKRALAAYNGGKGGNVTPPYRNAGYASRVLRQEQALKA